MPSIPAFSGFRRFGEGLAPANALALDLYRPDPKLYVGFDFHPNLALVASAGATCELRNGQTVSAGTPLAPQARKVLSGTPAATAHASGSASDVAKPGSGLPICQCRTFLKTQSSRMT